jgi:preprotein translocase subunit SecG
LANYFNIALIIVSITLILVIILQSKGAGLGGLTGGDFGGGTYHTRRGIERLLFNVTIGLSILFFALAILAVVLAI